MGFNGGTAARLGISVLTLSALVERKGTAVTNLRPHTRTETILTFISCSGRRSLRDH